MKHHLPRFFVWEGRILRAAQSTREGALRYWKPGRTITTKPTATGAAS